MIRIAVILFCFLISYQANAQKLPFGIDPVAFATDVNVPGAYEITAAKHIGCDTTLTFDELIFLYYGAAFRPGYAPYHGGFDNTDLIQLNREERYEEALKAGMEMLYREPGNARAYWEVGIAHFGLGDEAKAQCFVHQYYRLISVPYYSGDGSKENPFFVTNVGDEYLIIDELEFEFVSQTIVPPLDILKVYDSLNDMNLMLYFNISLPMHALSAQMNGEEEPIEEEQRGKRKKRKKKSDKRSKKR
jgi:hypothetical protein